MRDPLCDGCIALEECWGLDMRKRLQELSPPQTERKTVTPEAARKA